MIALAIRHLPTTTQSVCIVALSGTASAFVHPALHRPPVQLNNYARDTTIFRGTFRDKLFFLQLKPASTIQVRWREHPSKSSLCTTCTRRRRGHKGAHARAIYCDGHVTLFFTTYATGNMPAQLLICVVTVHHTRRRREHQNRLPSTTIYCTCTDNPRDIWAPPGSYLPPRGFSASPSRRHLSDSRAQPTSPRSPRARRRLEREGAVGIPTRTTHYP